MEGKKEKKKLTKRDRELMEFLDDGTWGYVHPKDGEAKEKKAKKAVKSFYESITQKQMKRAETNRIAALRKLAAVKRWKQQHEFDDSNDPYPDIKK